MKETKIYNLLKNKLFANIFCCSNQIVSFYCQQSNYLFSIIVMDAIVPFIRVGCFFILSSVKLCITDFLMERSNYSL